MMRNKRRIADEFFASRRDIACQCVEDDLDKIDDALMALDAVPGFLAKPAPKMSQRAVIGRLIWAWHKAAPRHDEHDQRDPKVGKKTVRLARKFLSDRLPELDSAKEAVEDALENTQIDR